jgi:uncharacterized protein (TIGR02145 family)
MNCSKCKAEWTPPAGRTITHCPFCGEALVATTFANKESALHEMLRSIVQQFGREILGEARLIGLLADFKPDTERKHLHILRQAVSDSIAPKLMGLIKNHNSGSILQINVLKEDLKNNHGFSNTADYVIDCLLYALGWTNDVPKEEQNFVQVNNLNILQHTVQMAFSDGRFTKEEAKSIFAMAETLSISEQDATGLIVQNLKKNQFKADKPFDNSNSTIKEIIISRNWISKANDTVVDKYESVKIGDQVWMKQNLDISNFRNGDPIPEVKTDEEWMKAVKDGKPAWCFYNNDPENGKIYGRLYNWYAVNDPRGLAPEGWHVPSDAEWSKLMNYLGGGEVAGGKMKTTDAINWNSSSQDTTNSSDFSGLPGGYRYTDGTFDGLGNGGDFWSSTESSATNAWYRYLLYNYANVYRYYFDKGYGFSVRCLRDATISLFFY